MNNPRWRASGRMLYFDNELVGMVDRPDIASDIVASMNTIGICRDCGEQVDPGYNMCARCADGRGP
jgi:hypothetical protein